MAPINKVPPISYVIDTEETATRFNLIVNLCFYVLFNGPNCEDFGIISISRVIFDQNLGF